MKIRHLMITQMRKKKKKRMSEQCVSTIPGCGPSKTKILNEVGIRTIDDLMKYSGPSPQGVNLVTLRFKVANSSHGEYPKSFSNVIPSKFSTTVDTDPNRIVNHSWTDRIGHIKTQGTLKRVVIKDLLFLKHMTVLLVQFNIRGTWHTRKVSPFMLFATSVLWNHQLILSDRESDLNEYKISVLPDLVVSQQQTVMTKEHTSFLKQLKTEMNKFRHMTVLL